MGHISLRKRTRRLVDPTHADGRGKLFNWVIISLILLNVLAVALETVDWIYAAYSAQFVLLETVSVAVFTAEYLARIWSAVEAGEPYDRPVVGRLRYATRPLLLLDLVAIAPFYITLVGGTSDLRFLRALRLMRFLRLFRLVRYSESMQAFGRAFALKRGQLVVAMTGNLILLVVASSLMYFAEHAAQPEAFPSIPGTMWWGIVTLTTVGYGDVTPVTPTGQVIGSAVAILGIGLFALPASIMASGFIQGSSYETGYCPDCGHEIDWESDVSADGPTYGVSNRVRIDITAESALDYDYHGVHGTVAEYDPDRDEYLIELDESEERLTATWKDLRTPLR
ncbi:ion transporter [Halorubrum lipolyticum]|uniref:Mvp-type potassium channel superfamily protein n=1 Tax=Halorubrum lipolyticum DSM 21995 TaxID=1227482 RepID=M0QSM1_9EURY|nr:ion transporter [Halorubrum lipolyticum]EMA58242.1 mvp-type potassium channel superfamily protein [Halorubrum lipolyticum DSM 21995]